jgi:hypothetical protein
MAQEYVKYKLHEAVEALAANPASIQRRLLNAGLILHSSNSDDFTDSADGERFGAVMSALTAHEAEGGEGTLEATTSRLSDEQAVEIAKEIVELDTICRRLD